MTRDRFDRSGLGRGGAFCEALENRTLLHNPFITGVMADNRGEVFIQFDSGSSELDPGGFTKQGVRMLTAGPDGLLNTADDERVPASVRFRTDNQRLLVRASPPLAPNTGYLVRIYATRAPSDPGFRLDGEFDGTFPTGDGLPGGNFEFVTKNDLTDDPRVRMATTEGPILVNMRRDAAPLTVQNFFDYADDGEFDNMFFTRVEPNFVVQGGSLRVVNNTVVETPVRAPVQNEFSISNTRGTLAMAKQGGDPNSATNQFFFNLGDNSANLDTQNGGFTVFAEVATPGGLAIMDAIAAKPRADLSTQIGPFSATGIDTVPVQDETQAQTDLDPERDLILVRRMARIMRVVPV